MFSNSSQNQMNGWRENLLVHKAKMDAKEELFNKMKESGEMYNNMVSEAVGFITTKITNETKKTYILEKAKDGIVTISILSALVITPDLHLYTAAYSVPRNPKTGKDYFFDSQQFKNEAEVEQFLKDVKAQLPEEVKFIERDTYPVECPSGKGRAYDVEVEFDLNNY